MPPRKRLITRLKVAVLVACALHAAAVSAQGPIDPFLLDPSSNISRLPPVDLPSVDEAWPTNSRVERLTWLDRSLHIDIFSGAVEGSPLVTGRVHQTGPGYLGGIAYGFDFNEHWGTEKRLGFATLPIANIDTTANNRTASAAFGEYRLLYYPLGDSRWRPYLVSGLGIADFKFQNDLNQRIKEPALLIPFGVGMKYMFHPRVAGRIEVLDDFSLAADGFASMHNVSLTAGLEYRFDAPQFLHRCNPFRK